ncbi:MAG TPA: hypothetical protein VFU42_10480 [Candidatus Deferrimicrobiaceae bacterium]|nr:hypothetical protein [Candidatus Deferrimicrobiaceae bacterium]
MKKGGSGVVTQSDLLTILAISTIAVTVGIALVIWKLLKTMENIANRLDESLRHCEIAVEDIRKTNAIVQGIMNHAGSCVANVEHVTEGVRKIRKTLDAATGVLDFAVIPVLGSVAGVLAGSKAAMSLVVNRIFRKEGRHGK